MSWQRRVAAALKPHDLTHVQFVLLATTWWLTDREGEQPRQRRIADFAGADPMMTSQVLRTLEGKGLIGRQDDPADARGKIVSVTPRGRRLALAAVHDVETIDHEFFAPVDKNALLGILHILEAG